MTYYNNPLINDWHKQIIIGTILGGSSIVKPKNGKNCYLFMRSSNVKWLHYKAAELEVLSSQNPFFQENNTLRWRSGCYPVFNEFHELFYKNKKKTIKMEVLDPLKDIGLAIWYGDSGKIKKDKVVLNTNKFGRDGNKVISKYFKEVGIGDTEITKEKGSTRLVFSYKATEKFLSLVLEKLPSFMH